MTGPRSRFTFRSLCMAALVALVAVSLGSCQATRNQLSFDRPVNKELQQYRDVMAPPPVEAAAADAPTPAFRPIVSVPSDMRLPSPLVTVSVNQTVALRDLLFELTEQAGVDLEMDPQIRGSIIFTAKDRPFSEVVDRICNMAGLRYTFEHNILRVEIDRPFVKTYKLDYVNVTRKSTSGIKIDLSVDSSGEEVTSGTSSKSSIDNTYDSKIWEEIETGLKQVLTASDTFVPLAVTDDPIATSVAPLLPDVNPNIPLPPPLPGNAGTVSAGPGQPEGAPAVPTDPSVPSAVAGSANAPAPTPVPSNSPPVLNIVQSSGGAAPANQPATYAISRETGVVHVFATERQHKLVQKYFNAFRNVSAVQVLIQAKVLEVTLNDEFQTGIKWDKFNVTGLSALAADFSPSELTPPTTNFFSANFNFGNVDFIVNALSRYGTVRTLSSPRVTVMNNNPAVVNMTSNAVYFDITTTTVAGQNGGPPTVTRTGETKSAPEGVLLNVLPSANPDTGEVLMAIRPTISKIVKQIEDPLNDGNFIPQMAVQEIDSIVKIQSGQTLVMGGLMRDQNIAAQTGIPVLNELPVLGLLFRNHVDNVNKSELVILLHATIVPGSSNADEMDKKIYREFGQDRRPVRL